MAQLDANGRLRTMMFPNPLLASAFLRRGIRLWIIARLAISGLVFLAGDDPFRLPIATMAVFTLVCALLGHVEMHLNHERDLLGNLGIKRRIVGLFFLGPALAGELLVRGLASLA